MTKTLTFQVSVTVPEDAQTCVARDAVSEAVRMGINEAISQYNNQYGEFSQTPFKELVPEFRLVSVKD